jgi:hypothetical protein
MGDNNGYCDDVLVNNITSIYQKAAKQANILPGHATVNVRKHKKGGPSHGLITSAGSCINVISQCAAESPERRGIWSCYTTTMHWVDYSPRFAAKKQDST